MTQNEIIEMARQSGFHDGLFSNESFKHHLAAFAYFVAAKERDEIADTLEHGYIDDEGCHIQYAKEIRARGEA
jgi:hypothetical protein